MFKTLKDRLYFLKRWYLLVFKYPQSTINPLASLDYDKYWEQKRGVAGTMRARQISGNERMRADYVASKIGNSTSVSIGDIACGPGVIFNYIKDKIRTSEYIGYEHSQYAIDVAKSLGMDARPFDINAEESISAIHEADYYLLLEILEHIPHSEKILVTLYAKARKGVFFSFPNSGNFLYRLRLLFGKMPMQWVNFPNEHLRFWTLADLRWWLRALGFSQYEIYCYRGIPFLEKIWPSLFAGSFVIYIPKLKE